MISYKGVIRLTLAITLLCTSHQSIYTQCDSITSNSSNLGIYGGYATGIKISPLNNRIFATYSNPYSMFISDDTCNSWYQAFPVDSLEYNCAQEGWGGRGVQVLANQNAWVLVHTDEHGGVLKSVVINFENGDTNKWETLITPYKLTTQMGYGGYTISTMSIDLTDYRAFVAMGPFLLKKDTASLIVENIISLIPGIDSSSQLVDIAATNTASGYPLYIIVDTLNDSEDDGILYKYDGFTFDELKLPAYFSDSTFYKVFVNQNDINGDTLFVTSQSGINPNIYSSYDGGVSWNQNTISALPQMLESIHYSDAWKKYYPKSAGIILSSQNYYSVDLGNSWNLQGKDHLGDEVQHAIVFPNDTSVVVGTNEIFPVISTNGWTGVYQPRVNSGLEAVNVEQISRSKGKNVFAVITEAGLGITYSYLDSTLKNYEKWIPPYGEFPVDYGGSGGQKDAGAVAINPYDSLNIVASINYAGFSVTLNGLNNFTLSKPSGFNSNNYIVNDIIFIDSITVIAVSGAISTIGADTVGDIWRSVDKGQNWTKISPSGFNNGYTIAVGYNPDTVIYIGTGYANVVGGELWKSEDKGINWSYVNDGPQSYTGLYNSLAIGDIEVNAKNADSLFISSLDGDIENVVVLSDDGGLSYTKLNFPNPIAEISSLQIEKQNTDYLYGASRREIYAYNLKNSTTIEIYKGPPGEFVKDLANGSLLCGTSTGFYSISLEPYPEIVISEVPNVAFHHNINIYPNPAGQIINLSMSDEKYNSLEKVTITDIWGRNFLLPVTKQKTLDITFLKSGIYYVNIYYSNNVESKSFIVDKRNNDHATH